jgi:hypothetical protein
VLKLPPFRRPLSKDQRFRLAVFDEQFAVIGAEGLQSRIHGMANRLSRQVVLGFEWP